VMRCSSKLCVRWPRPAAVSQSTTFSTVQSSTEFAETTAQAGISTQASDSGASARGCSMMPTNAGGAAGGGDAGAGRAGGGVGGPCGGGIGAGRLTTG